MPRVRTTTNREQWLTEAASLIEPFFADWYDLGPYRVSCGWPCSGALTGKTLGQCFNPKVSAGGVHELFISPLLADVPAVSGVLTHELAHVAAGVEAAHGKKFVAACNRAGVTEGPPTSRLPGKALAGELVRVLKSLGPYPHSAMRPDGKAKKEREPSGYTLTCECGCKVRIARKWLESVGAPSCGCGGVMKVEAAEGEGEE